MVAEHLGNPRAAFGEMARVLKPGGRICFQTPNRLYYPMLVAQATPTRLHQQPGPPLRIGRNEAEVFPTFYRANTAGAVRRLASEIGLRAEVRLVAVPPGYLRFHPAAFMSGVLYERIVERLIPPLRGQIWATLTKPDRG